MKVPYIDLPKTARVWIYQNTSVIDPAVQDAIESKLDQFSSKWSAHNHPLASHCEIRHNRFLILIVDEAQNMASGCSIDASVHFIRQLESAYSLDLFNRMVFSYQKDGEVITVPKIEFARQYASGMIDDETLVFDNLIKTKEDLENRWLKPLGESWHRRFVQTLVS